jgi:NADH-quinone oxidoreductase subunit M
MGGNWVLSALLVLPVVGAILIALLRGDSKETVQNARYIAFWTTAITFLVSLYAWHEFDPAKPGFQLVEQSNWFSSIILYKLGVDGISLPFVLLTTFLMPICILASWRSITTRVKAYFICFLIL